MNNSLPMSMCITYIGHATVHVQNGPLSFLTDPVFSQRIFWLKRHSPLPFPPEDLPEPTAIFISHAHYDHLDIHSFKYFSSKVPVVLPKGLGQFLSRFVKNPILEMSPGETHEILPGLGVTAFAVAHNGFRLSGLTLRGCNGYLITLGGKRVFFPGDTGYRKDFQAFQNVDAALLPVGPCRPEWFMRPIHLNPADLVKLTEDMRPKMTIPIHWGAFRLGLEPVLHPIDELKRLIGERSLGGRINILNPGGTCTLD